MKISAVSPGWGDMREGGVMDEQITVIIDETSVVIYEPPVLVELGEFGEDTLGLGRYHLDNTAYQE
jgi:hypothetical protein